MNTANFYGDLVNSNRIIYTATTFAKNNLIHLQEAGTTQAVQPHKSTRSKLSSYLFFIVKKGSGTLEYDNQTHYIKTGDCVFIDCKKEYSQCSSLNLWEIQWVHFYGPNISSIYKKYIERGGLPCFSTNHYTSYEDILTTIHTIARSDDFIKDMNIYSKLTELLTLLMSDSWHKDAFKKLNNTKRDLQVVKEYLDVNYSDKLTLDSLSEQFFINKYYLTRLFKEQFGLSLIDYLLHVRITHAKQLLRFSNLSIEKVGVQCGIPDANYFTRIFKKIEGNSPKEYRKMW